MPENFEYKEYTEEENKTYDEAVAKIRASIKNGLNFNEACSVIDVDDPELKKFIIDDALKVLIAEMHYGKNMLLPQVSETLKVPLKLISHANMEMLEDAGITAAEMYKKTIPDNQIGNA